MPRAVYMWDSFVALLANLIAACYELTRFLGFPNYGLAIILFTVIMRLLMFPLSLKQSKSTRAMTLIQPHTKRLQEKYKGDPHTLSREMSALYKKHGVNPLSGCLPMLITMPVLFALFRALRGFDYSGEGESFFWLTSMTEPDTTIILPVIVGLTSFLQSKLAAAAQPPAANDQAKSMNIMMLYGMPVMMGFMTRSFPAGLGIYWSISNVSGALMQVAIDKIVNRSHEGLKEAIEAEELIEQAEAAETESLAPEQEADRESLEHDSMADRENEDDSPRGRDDLKGKALDFDDYA